jgi:hypothetical protein
VRRAHSEVGDADDADVMEVREEVVRPVIVLYDRIEDEIARGVGQHHLVVEVVRLIVPVAAVIDYQGIYRYDVDGLLLNMQQASA